MNLCIKNRSTQHFGSPHSLKSEPCLRSTDAGLEFKDNIQGYAGVLHSRIAFKDCIQGFKEGKSNNNVLKIRIDPIVNKECNCHEHVYME